MSMFNIVKVTPIHMYFHVIFLNFVSFCPSSSIFFFFCLTQIANGLVNVPFDIFKTFINHHTGATLAVSQLNQKYHPAKFVNQVANTAAF